MSCEGKPGRKCMVYILLRSRLDTMKTLIAHFTHVTAHKKPAQKDCWE